jgi:cysteine-rich repeat protein
MAVAGSARGDAPYFLAYVTPDADNCDLGELDPAEFQNSPGELPVLPALELPVGGAAAPFDLCVIHWPVVDSDPGTVGTTGTGTEVCAVRLNFGVLGNGIEMTAFTPAVPGSGEFQANLASPILLTVAGGDPFACQQANGVIGTPLGTLMLKGTSVNSVLELQTGTFANASNQPVSTENQVAAMTMNTCGNGPPHDPSAGEECDDGNSVAGDGCLDCRLEDGFALTGQASATNPGTIEFEVNGAPVTVTLTANQPADEVITLVVATINASSSAQAEAIDEPSLPAANMQRMVAGGDITEDTIVDPEPQGTLQFFTVPEPGSLLMLLSGVVLLLIGGRGRIQA